MIAFLRWWVIFWLVVAGFVTAGAFDLHEYIWKVDQTRLSFVIVTIFAVFTVFIGLLTAHARRGDQLFRKHLSLCSYVATDVCQGLGMIGTLIGFLLLLQTVFSGQVDLANTAATQKVLSNMATGFATAAVTTLVGLACSLALKAQIINLEYLVEDDDA